MKTDELEETTRSYSSGVGAKFIEIRREIAGQSGGIGQRWRQKLGAEIEQEVRRKAKKRGLDL